tara:strand:+ start:4855 stop:6093 length:1239 start_codon:yes stop_codon:yes gene_type:complete
MMKNLLILITLISGTLYGQDPSFSQIDSYSMYMNPAFCGSSGHPKFLTLRREQWKGINGSGNQAAIGGSSPFTTTLVETSFGIYGDNSRSGGIKAFNFGISYLGEDNLLDENLEGSVFVRRADYSAYISFLLKLDNMKPLKKSIFFQQKYLQFGLSLGGTSFGLNTDNLIFSNMIDAYGGTYPLATNLPYNSNNNKVFPRFSTGIVFSMLGNNSSTKQNKTILGYSFQTLNENFQLSSSLSTKHTFHIEHKGTVPIWNQKMIPHWKVFYKSEHYKTNGWGSKKYEIGQSIDIGRSSPIELGQLFRFSANLPNNNLHFQTYVPFIRLNLFGVNHGYQITYIYYEYERAINSDDYLYIGNTGLTHEIGFTIHLWGGKGAKECIEYGRMQNNALFKDLRNNGLLSKQNSRKNFGR